MKKILNFIVIIFILLVIPKNRVFGQQNSVWCDANCNTTGIYCDSGYAVPKECQSSPTNCCYILYGGSGACPQFISCVAETGLTPTATPTLPSQETCDPNAWINCFSCRWEGNSCEVSYSQANCEPGFEPNPGICNAITDPDQCNGTMNLDCREVDPNNHFKCFRIGDLYCGPVHPGDPEYDSSYSTWEECDNYCRNSIKRYDCYGDKCQENPNGEYPTLPECEANCKGCIETAIGCIYVVTPEGFIKELMIFAIGIGGGIAFLLMIFGTLLILTSAGNPDKIKTGKELITSAIIGLILIIFAVFFEELVIVKILQIPGFS